MSMTRRASSTRTMSPIEVGWVAGFIEADGWAGIHTTRGYSQAEIVAAGTNPEHISALLRATGVGRVCYQARPSKLTSTPQPMWYWKVSRHNDILSLIDQLQPYSLKVQKLAEKLNGNGLD